MTDTNRTLLKHAIAAKEHLAAVSGARTEVQALAGEHLARTQRPAHGEPVKPESGGGS